MLSARCADSCVTGRNDPLTVGAQNATSRQAARDGNRKVSCSELAHRTVEPLLLPLTESGGAKRTQGAVAGGCFAALTPGAAARRLTAPRSCSAPKEPLQLSESGGAKRKQGAVAGGCFAALPLEAAARR